MVPSRSGRQIATLSEYSRSRAWSLPACSPRSRSRRHRRAYWARTTEFTFGSIARLVQVPYGLPTSEVRVRAGPDRETCETIHFVFPMKTRRCSLAPTHPQYRRVFGRPLEGRAATCAAAALGWDTTWMRQQIDSSRFYQLITPCCLRSACKTLRASSRYAGWTSVALRSASCAALRTEFAASGFASASRTRQRHPPLHRSGSLRAHHTR